MICLRPLLITHVSKKSNHEVISEWPDFLHRYDLLLELTKETTKQPVRIVGYRFEIGTAILECETHLQLVATTRARRPQFWES
jgi:hypothetical protein